MLAIIILALLSIFSGAATILALETGYQMAAYFFKPTTMALILLLVLQIKNPVSPRYKYTIFVGLVFSMIGDVLLMLPQDLFIFGLLSFLIAHLIYIFAFRLSARYGWGWLWTIPFLLFGGVVFWLLSPGLGDFLVPVAIYMTAILVMAWQGWVRWRALGSTAALFGAIGAFLFVASDTILAFNRFSVPVPHPDLWILGTYFLAQLLIALSVRESA